MSFDIPLSVIPFFYGRIGFLKNAFDELFSEIRNSKESYTNQFLYISSQIGLNSFTLEFRNGIFKSAEK